MDKISYEFKVAWRPVYLHYVVHTVDGFTVRAQVTKKVFRCLEELLRPSSQQDLINKLGVYWVGPDVAVSLNRKENGRLHAYVTWYSAEDDKLLLWIKQLHIQHNLEGEYSGKHHTISEVRITSFNMNQE